MNVVRCLKSQGALSIGEVAVSVGVVDWWRLVQEGDGNPEQVLPIIKRGWGMSGCRPVATFNALPWLTVTVSNEFYSLPSFECRWRSWGYLRGMIDGMESDVWGGIKEDRREMDTDADMYVPLLAKCGGRWVQSNVEGIDTNVVIQGPFHKLEN